MFNDSQGVARDAAASAARSGSARSSSPELRLRRGERLAPDRAQGLLVVSEGLVAVSTVLPDGRRQILCLNVPGETVCPICESTVWLEGLADSAIRQMPAEGDDVGAAMLRLAHQRLKDANAHLLSLGRFDGTERVAAFLVDMCRRVGRPILGGGAALHLPMSRDDIADYLGLNAETVSRILSRMKRADLLRFGAPTDILVPDLARLADRSPAPCAAMPWEDMP